MMGKPDTLDRVVQVLLGLTALIALANGLFMLISPFDWYEAVGTVKATGPANGHFIRDIGIAYLVCAAILGFAAINPPMRWLAAFAGNLWLTAHGILHIWEVVVGICAPNIFWQDAPGTLGPPLLGWIALGILFARQRIAPAGVPNSVYLRAVEAIMPDEMAYIREIAAAPGHALEKFKHFMPVTIYRHATPADLFHMAKIGATLAEDCGPCALTAAHGALTDGVSRDLLNAALRSEPPEGELRQAFAFGAAIAHQSGDAFDLGDAIEATHGRAVRLELAMTAATVRSYPAMKRGLGLSKSCSLTRLEV